MKKWLRHSPKEQRRFWANTQYGQAILDAERGLVNRWLKSNDNDINVELASIESPPLNQENNLIFSAASSSWREPVVASLSSLPVSNRSVDNIIWRFLPLDWQLRQYLLEEVERVLVPGGHLMLVALNPLHANSWRCYGVYNIAYQASSAIVPLARQVGLTVKQRAWCGPGRWRFAGMQGILMQKSQPSLKLKTKPKRRLQQVAAGIY